MTIWLWWHDEKPWEALNADSPCRWASTVKARPADIGYRPNACTCLRDDLTPLPGRWREFREVLPLPKEEDFECL